MQPKLASIPEQQLKRENATMNIFTAPSIGKELQSADEPTTVRNLIREKTTETSINITENDSMITCTTLKAIYDRSC